jgi:hypothetical protein
VALVADALLDCSARRIGPLAGDGGLRSAWKLASSNSVQAGRMPPSHFWTAGF